MGWEKLLRCKSHLYSPNTTERTALGALDASATSKRKQKTWGKGIC